MTMHLWCSALEPWNEAGWRWWDGASVVEAGGPARGGDKRFAAPESYANPVYRTLKEAYLLASDWLLKRIHPAGLSITHILMRMAGRERQERLIRPSLL